uniref:Coagulation factor VIII, procoagulant component n=1 Tax=Oncorhynchus kisutch TaxID=8019 RepID=A0A8C7ICC1_ONCKI
MRTLLISLLWVLGGVEETVAVPALGRHATREFYIAAVEIGWDYLYWGSADSSEQRRRTKDPPQKYIKAVYREYTDSTYSVPKPTSTWAGIQGPVIHAQASDRVVVHFKNLASQPYSISPVGVSYWKQSEGAGYDDATSSQEKEDDAVAPGGYYKYVWDINPNDGPTVGDPECLTYSYSSQVDTVQDFNSGLIGALLICKSIRKSREFILLFAVFDESKSWYGEVGSFRERFKKASARKQYHTINGYVNSTLPGQELGRDHVFWHLIGMETSPEIHSIQFQDHTLQVMAHRKITVEMTPMTFTTAELKPSTQGKFLISCQIQANSHGKMGMSAVFEVEDCPEPVTVPGPDVRRVQQSENEEDYEYGDDMFELFVFKPVKSRAVGRSRGGKNKVWVHYIAAEEISWDYAPHLSQGDSQLLSEYFPRGPHQLGHEYKKVVYVEYTDQTFTKRKSPVKRLLGPLLRGQVDEHFQIVFKNLASRPFNMYPNGLTRISPLRKTENEGEKDLRSLAVPPNGTYGYVWKLTAEDGPLEGDPQCLTRLYQSTINPERDLATGLIGPLLICKKDSMDTRGRLVGPDKVKQLMFAVFDENKSWYINDNIQKYSKDPSMVNPTDPDFYNSNVIYNVNGIMFNEQRVQVCKDDVTFWHLSNVGTQSDFLSVYFTGNPFMKDNVYESVLTLFPMSGETVTMESQLIGKVKGQMILLQLYSQQREEQKVEVLDQLKVEEQKAGDVHPLSNNTHTELDTPLLDLLDLNFSNVSNDNETAPRNAVSLEYDDYSEEDTGTAYIGTEDNLDLRATDGQYRSYYIAAQEITWDYGIRKPHQRMGMRKFLAEYKKVVFRAYSDRDFQIPVTRGELQEHLGLMGPIIKAEVNDLLTVTFKNMASRPYSLHLHGVYDKSQGDGQSSGAGVAGVPGEAVQPGEVRVYTWRITRKQGPTAAEFDCKAGAYYSTQNKEKDLHSGLIGPLVICKPGTLHPQLNLQPNLQEYALLFHTFDETKSWYLDENIRRYCTPPCQAQKDDPWFQLSNKFAAINGYVAETLPGLTVAQHQQVRWHLLNVGGDGEYHTAHFHGLPFSIHKEQEHRMGVYNLYPGVFGTVEMRPATVGTWMVECTVGEHQLAGMRAKLLVYNPRNWEARLARLELSGSVNAWMGADQKSWIQVDLQRPTLIHGIQTQGARASLGLKDYFIMYFTLSYSLDQETWTNYRGNSTTPTYIFNGNLDGSKVKENYLSPPILGRYIRLQPVTIQRNPALRMELLGCDVNSCSFPLGLQRRLVPDSSFRASSFLQTWRLSWGPALARLRQDGSANAWRPKANNPQEWLQVDFLVMKRITGVVTQGAWSILSQMMVTEFSVTISDNGHSWSNVVDEGTQREKMFLGNSEPDEEMLNLFDPPLFARFIRIHPRGWLNDIALRLEFMGCDTQQRH